MSVVSDVFKDGFKRSVLLMVVSAVALVLSFSRGSPSSYAGSP